jgi:hypothetical protein
VIKNGSHQEPFYPHERYAIIERMKTGDKAFLRLDGVVYVGTVKRAFLSPFGVPSVWIEWPKDNPSPSRNIFYERDLMSPTDDPQKSG